MNYVDYCEISIAISNTAHNTYFKRRLQSVQMLKYGEQMWLLENK